MRAMQVFSSLLGLLVAANSAVADLWTTPVPVGEVNTEYDEGAPFLTYDGRALYFSRQGVPGPYPGRLYSATRAAPVGPFTSESELTTLNSAGSIVNYSWVSQDNLRLYYYQTLGGGHVIKMSGRASTADLWQAGTDVAELNALGGVANPSLTPDELTIVFTGTEVPGGLGGYDIWMGTRPDTYSPFTDFRNLSEINSTAWDFHPRLSSDGLTLYFASKRYGESQLFKATRPGTDALFGSPEHLSFFNSPGAALEYPAISADAKALYFTRVTSDTSYDIYVSYVVPAPSAVILGAIGLSYAGWRLRRRTQDFQSEPCNRGLRGTSGSTLRR